jgi:hypothetical protein
MWSDPNFYPMNVSYPNAGLKSNYCRNPDGEKLNGVAGIWCYIDLSETKDAGITEETIKASGATKSGVNMWDFCDYQDNP